MEVNLGKFNVMELHRSDVNMEMSVSPDGATPVVKKCVKLLGVNIDSELSFDFHIKDLCRKAGGQLNALLRLQKLLDAKLAVVWSFVCSNFKYGTVVLIGILVPKKYLETLNDSEKSIEEYL